jgi:eukaryotic-like serine/threonine-protein kinase
VGSGYAELCLFLGYVDEYRSARRALLARFGENTDPQIAERTARACLLGPASGDELEKAVVLARCAYAVDRSKYEGIYPYFEFVQGLAEFRRGRFGPAISLMRGGASRALEPAPRLVLAMALHRDGQTVEARKTLAAAVQSHDWSTSRARHQHDWIYHVLRREAEAMIVPDSRSFLYGTCHPSNNDEQLRTILQCPFEIPAIPPASPLQSMLKPRLLS